MTTKRISRRDFLKVSGIVLGSTLLVGSGLSVLENQQPEISLPEFQFGENQMSKKILVTYASQSGSTAGIAEAIGKSLSDGGAQVDVVPMNKVQDLSTYSAVIAGSAIQGQKWLPEAMQFMRDHQSELSRKPFASFMSCITLSMKNADQYRDGLKEWMSPVRAMVRPVSEGYFAGTLEFSKIPFSFNTLAMRIPVLMGIWKEGDHRDWNAIRNWAEGLRPLLLRV
ncbi:MAG: flavodoxin [Chloroflexi bacterium HGW-Chloroflexi-8]|nr:MAG: flavodoxin [Chloroflexi bacterium HGW-Chloroflexi-8]